MVGGHLFSLKTLLLVFLFFLDDTKLEVRPGMRGGHQMVIDVQSGMFLGTTVIVCPKISYIIYFDNIVYANSEALD